MLNVVVVLDFQLPFFVCVAGTPEESHLHDLFAPGGIGSFASQGRRS